MLESWIQINQSRIACINQSLISYNLHRRNGVYCRALELISAITMIRHNRLE